MFIGQISFGYGNITKTLIHNSLKSIYFKRAKAILKTLEDNDLMKPKMVTEIPEEKEPEIQMSFESNSREYI
ncbi:MAG: hypothetical protein IIX88_06065, partial [Firmicutes bacterium]|nr:hypothetical protein [Bacillota bacterium]